MAKQSKESMYLTLEDFPQAIDVRMENGWIVVVLPACRVKFKNWVTQ